MGILPIGFFSPLPLAMMIPFMATQSLAMGEAFGKSFQYGKRKISSMSNEEFNKLTFHDLMVEQTANIRAIVPELSKQMAQSKEMQSAIFAEMINLIPAFFDSLFSALDPKHIENQKLISQASPPPTITEIRYAGQQTKFNDPAIEELQKQLDKALLEQRGTKESLAEKLRLEALPPPPPPTVPTPPTKAELAAAEKLRANTEWIAWSTKLGALKSLFTRTASQLKKLNINLNNQPTQLRGAVINQIRPLESKQRDTKSKIRAMSQDYRHPNNAIRENALRLRQAIASGQYT